MPFAKIDGRQIHYTVYEPEDSTAQTQTIIFVHGLGSTQNYYGPILPYLSKYRCVTFDNYAAGRSKYYSELAPDTSIKQIAQDVLSLLDHLKVDKAVVVGYSMGGMIPTTIAADEKGKSRIIAGVLLGPVHPNDMIHGVMDGRVKSVTEGGIETMANTVPGTATGPNTTQLQKSFIREMIMSQDPKGYIANCKAIKNAVAPNYEAVKCPIYIISGKVDKSAPPQGCQLIHDSVVNAEDRKIDYIEDMGHWYCVEDPKLIGESIASWLDSHVSKA